MSREGIGRFAVITGVGRRRSIGTEIAQHLARDGWHLALNYWRPYDDRLGYERNADDPESIADSCRAFGVHVELVPGNLGDPVVPAELVRTATRRRVCQTTHGSTRRSASAHSRGCVARRTPRTLGWVSAPPCRGWRTSQPHWGCRPPLPCGCRSCGFADTVREPETRPGRRTRL